MATPRGRYFPKPFRIDGAQAPSTSQSSGSAEDRTHDASQAASSSRRSLFSSELPPPKRLNEDGTENVEWARYESTLRLRSKWDSIYERYKDAHLIEQDEIFLGATSKSEGKRKASDRPRKLTATAGRGRKRKRAAYTRPSSDGSNAESEDESSWSGNSSASESAKGQVRVVRDCGTLRNLPGAVKFGAFILDDELDALGTASFPDDAQHTGKSRDQAGPSDDELEREFESDEDEIGGWGEFDSIRAQYPEFSSQSARPDHDEGEVSASRTRDPHLEEFLEAERRRKRFCAENGIDDDADSEIDEGLCDHDDDHTPRSSDAALPVSPVLDSPEVVGSDSDDDLDLLSSPRRGGANSTAVQVKRSAQPPPAKADSTAHAPEATKQLVTTGNPRMIADPRSDSASLSGKAATILPTFESAQLQKRSAVDKVIARWTTEQEEHLQMEEDAQNAFGPARLRLEQGSVLLDPFDSLPASYRDIPGLQEMLEGDWVD